jgi:hypothetical protein
VPYAFETLGRKLSTSAQSGELDSPPPRLITCDLLGSLLAAQIVGGKPFPKYREVTASTSFAASSLRCPAACGIIRSI